jgi:hypothetical protein
MEGFRCGPGLIGLSDVQLGSQLGIGIAIDFPKKIDGTSARWTNEDLGIVDVRRLLIRAVLPRAQARKIGAAKNLTQEPIYIRAREVALERVESLFDAIAKATTGEAPRLEAPLPIGLCQVFYGRKERMVEAMTPPIILYTAKPPTVTESSLPNLVKDARAERRLRLAWRLFRRARQLGEEEESLSEAIVVAVSSLEVGLTRALVWKAVSNSQRKKIENTKLSLLLGSVTTGKGTPDWSTLLLGASLKTALPAEFGVVDRLRTERNKIVHDGRPPSTSWPLLRGQLESIRRLLQWLESRL